MKICMITESFLPVTGGLQFQIKYLTEELADQKAEIFLLSYKDGENYIKKNGLGFPKFIKLRSKNRITGFFELLYWIKKTSPDIIHIHSAETDAFQISLLKFFKIIRQPIVITSHGSDIMTYPQANYGIRLKPFFSKMVKFTLKICDRHVIVGKSMESFAVEAGSNKDKISEINNGVPLEKKEIAKEKNDSVMEKFQIAPQDRILLSLSGLRPLKGIDILIKSFSIIVKKIPEAKLLLACSSDEYEKLMKKLVDDLFLNEKVKFIGFITDEEEKVSLIRKCEIFCKPSRLEACSVAILEAMREGKAVIASVPGGIDIIQDGVDGILVPAENHIAFAQAVIKILLSGEIREKIEKNAQENIKKFDIKNTASKYINLYSNLKNVDKYHTGF